MGPPRSWWMRWLRGWRVRAWRSRAVDALGTEELISDAEERRGTVDGEVITGAGALVPAGHDEVAEVGHMVEVVVGEEELVDLQRID